MRLLFSELPTSVLSGWGLATCSAAESFFTLFFIWNEPVALEVCFGSSMCWKRLSATSGTEWWSYFLSQYFIVHLWIHDTIYEAPQHLQHSCSPTQEHCHHHALLLVPGIFHRIPHPRDAIQFGTFKCRVPGVFGIVNKDPGRFWQGFFVHGLQQWLPSWPMHSTPMWRATGNTHPSLTFKWFSQLCELAYRFPSTSLFTNAPDEVWTSVDGLVVSASFPQIQRFWIWTFFEFWNFLRQYSNVLAISYKLDLFCAKKWFPFLGHWTAVFHEFLS